MTTYNENDSVIYTDAEGQMIDTFVIFETDRITGLTHINHQNLKVPVSALQLHPSTIGKYHLPMRDAFSFEIFKLLKEKYSVEKPVVERKLKLKTSDGAVLAQAS